MCECNGGAFSDHDIFSEDESCDDFVSFTADEEEFCCNLTQFLEVEGRLAICIIGIIFNTIAVILLLDKKLSKEIFNRLLMCLVMMDNVYLVIGVLTVWINSMDQPSFEGLCFYFYFIRPLRGIAMCSIIYMTILLAFQRYMYVTRPLDSRIRNDQHFGATWKKVFYYVGPVILISFAYHLPVFFEVTIGTCSESDEKCFDNSTTIVLSKKVERNDSYDVVTRLSISKFRSNGMYSLLYLNIGNIVLTGIVPLLLLVYFNFFVVRGMRKFERKRSVRRQESFQTEKKKDSQEEKELKNQRNQTIILFSIVIIFLICHCLRIVLNAHDLATHKNMFQRSEENCNHGHPYWVNIGHPISETFLKINSIANFFIYCAFNNRFRKAVRNRLLQIFNLCGIGNCLADSSRSQYAQSKSSQDQKNSCACTYETE